MSLGAAIVATFALSFASLWLSDRSARRLDRRAAGGTTGAASAVGGYDVGYGGTYGAGTDGCSTGSGSDGCSR